MQKKLGKVFLFLGLIFSIATSYLFWERSNPFKISFKETTTDSKNPVPARIVIKSVKIDLPVISGDTKNGVSYLSSSALPDKSGNSVFYGHNWANLLGNLDKIKQEDKVEIIMSDGRKLNFKVAFTSIATPDQTHFIKPTSDKRITLYTCTGLFDTKRFVVTAIPTV